MTIEFRLFSLNTHLFGRHWFTPTWNDTERAVEIGDWLRINKPDVVALQEVWDENLFDDHIEPRSEYRSSGYGGAKDWIGVNSGLALLSLHQGIDIVQEEFDDESGIDAFATKGWIRGTLFKGGISITIFNTHTQSGSAEQVRSLQLEQLADAVREFRKENPTHVVFVVGDFNVPKSSREFKEVLVPKFGTGYLEFSGESYSDDNLLKMFFGAHNEPGLVDHMFFYGSSTVSVRPAKSDAGKIVKIAGATKTGKGLTTDEVSDHWALDGRFILERKQQE